MYEQTQSFTTALFVSTEAVEAALAGPRGRVVLDDAMLERLEKGEMRCHKCRAPMANLSKLKAHLPSCRAKPS
jgi:hypothetical protein